MTSATPPPVKTRQISARDIPAIIELTLAGFAVPRRRRFWENFFACLHRRAVPSGYPRYGHLMESDGRIVGFLMLIYSKVCENGQESIRCNVTTFYIEPTFRIFASLLAAIPLKDKAVTVVNITPASHTQKMIEATGFVKYSEGGFFAIPLLSPASKILRVRVIDGLSTPDVPHERHEHELLLEHAHYGCTTLWCVTEEEAHPFVFRAHKVRNLFPCSRLVYCRKAETFVQFARPIGLYLARKFQLLVVLDANEPLPGLFGIHHPGYSPRYFHGPNRPKLGDLAYTETALFDI